MDDPAVDDGKCRPCECSRTPGLDPDIARRSVCYVETVGRRSGRPHEVEIWFAADPTRDRIYILSGGREQAHWVRNIQRTLSVRVRIGERWFTGRAASI